MHLASVCSTAACSNADYKTGFYAGYTFFYVVLALFVFWVLRGAVRFFRPTRRKR
jgi:hypothetical protein